MNPELKRYRLGTDRVLDPAETLARARPVAARCGVSRLANITGLDRIGIPVVSAVRPLSRSVTVAQGKGVTLTAARVSALMEAIEGHHAENITSPLICEAVQDARRKRPTVDVERLPLFGGAPLDLRRRILWIEGRRIDTAEPLWVPLDSVHTDYTFNVAAGPPMFFCSSNGLASGNTHGEATAHALCEVIERDALTMCGNRRGTPRADLLVDPDTITDPVCRDLLERFAAAGVNVIIEDCTSDLGIPCLCCTVWDCERAVLRPMLPIAGFGCHPRKEVALARALTEAAQGRAILISGSRDDLSLWLYDEAQALRLAAGADALRSSSTGRSFADLPSHDAEAVTDDLAWIVGRLGAAGLPEVAVVDLTKEEHGIPVVRVVVPGLEAMSEAPGYVPGARARARTRNGDN
jgi:YcaO-like protein with predicted kinase domain